MIWAYREPLPAQEVVHRQDETDQRELKLVAPGYQETGGQVMRGARRGRAEEEDERKIGARGRQVPAVSSSPIITISMVGL